MDIMSNWSTESSDSEELEKPNAKVSMLEAYINLVTVIIGAGILALPQLPVRSGWILSILLLVLSAVAVQEPARQLSKTLMAADDKVTTYEGLAETALGLLGRTVTALVVNIFLLGICSAYAALIGMQLHHLTGLFNQRIWILLASPVFVVLALLPNLSVLSKLVPLGMLAACITAFIIIWRSWEDAALWRSWEEDEEDIHHLWPTNIFASGAALATCLAAFTLVPVVPPIIRDMAQPERFIGALNAALVTCGSLYLAVMLCGYYGYGNFISNDLVESMSISPSSFDEAMLVEATEWTGPQRLWLRVLMSVLILVNIILSMPLLAMTVFYSIESAGSKWHYVQPGTWSNWIMRISIIAGVVAVAMAIPRFTVIFGFFSSLAAPCVSIVLPLLIAGMLEKMSCWRRAYHGSLVLLATLCMVSGMYTSVMDVVNT